MFVDSKTSIPCITYMEVQNAADKEGDTLRYSNLSFSIKVWGKDLQTLSQYANLIDKLMFDKGFKRTNTIELWLDGIGQRQLKFEALAQEFD